MITGIYNLTPPTLSDGQQVQIQTDAAGNLKISSGSTGASANQVQGNLADGVADSGNSVKIGGIGRNALGSAVANGQRVSASFGIYGQLFTSNAIPSQFPAADANANSAVGYQLDLSGGPAIPATASVVFNGTTWDRTRGDANGAVVQPALSTAFWGYAGIAGGIVSSTADVAMKAAAGASVRNYIKSLTIAHDVLSAVTECVVKDGSTIIWRGKLQTPAVDAAAGSGTIIFDPPLRGTANTALNFALLSSVTGGVFVNAQGYTGV